MILIYLETAEQTNRTKIYTYSLILWECSLLDFSNLFGSLPYTYYSYQDSHIYFVLAQENKLIFLLIPLITKKAGHYLVNFNLST